MANFAKQTYHKKRRMKQNKKAIVDFLSKKAAKKDEKFESLVINLALQKIDSDSFDTDNDAVYTADRKRLVYCMTDNDNFTIPEGVEVVGEMAFLGKKELKSVVIAASVKDIEKKAFYDCDLLEDVIIPAGVEEIKSQAFSDCDNLKSITFFGAPKHLSRHALDDCDKLHYVIVPEGCGKAFKKALHYIDGDTEFSVVENSGIKAEKPTKKDQAEKPAKKDVAEKPTDKVKAEKGTEQEKGKTKDKKKPKTVNDKKGDTATGDAPTKEK